MISLSQAEVASINLRAHLQQQNNSDLSL